MGRPRKGTLIYTPSGWAARITTEVDGETVRPWRQLGTHNEQVARVKLKKLMAAGDVRSVDVREPESFEEAARRVYGARARLRPADAGRGLGQLVLHAFPKIGPKPVTVVTSLDIEDVLAAARDEGGLARESCKHLRQHLSNVFAALKAVVPVNPVAGVQLPDFPAELVKERAVLTDEELAVYLTYEPEDRRAVRGVLERQVMACVSRMFGGLRTGDLHALRWESFDVELGGFAWGWAPRNKTKRPQRLAIPELLRPLLADWWQRQGRPRQGLLFPALRGQRAGVGVKRGVSHAVAQRKDLQAAFTAAVEKGIEAPRQDSVRWRELFEETDYTLPVDFHSWRRAYCQALADAEVNAQQAAALAGHGDLGAHMRYLRSSQTARELPAAAVPLLATRLVKAPDQTPRAEEESEMNSAGGTRFERVTFGSGGNREQCHPEEDRADTCEPDPTSNTAERSGTPPPTQSHRRNPSSKTSPFATAGEGELPTGGGSAISVPDAVTDALRAGLQAATAEGDWSRVAQLAQALDARQASLAATVDLSSARRRRGRRGV